ncbi:MAG: DUF423 domain-containing protein [Flavobacteriaceae bacterium]|nr:DUF423 domain-containing protein [Flavobacteriaceae bacterium]
MEKKIFISASLLGLLAVVLGAFAAHGLRDALNTTSLESFQTGVRYQMYHAFFLFVVGLLPQLTLAQKSRLFWVTIIGVVLFSGSIYLLSSNTLTPIDFGFLGPITPIGGLFLISAWVVLFYHLLKNKF